MANSISRFHVLMTAAVLCLGAAIYGFGNKVAAQDITEAHRRSILYQNLQEYLHRQVLLSSTTGQHDSLSEYAAKCAEATGVSIPRFSCSAGVEVPGQGTTPAGTLCDAPNSLNKVCDPGSRFQVLPGRTQDAVAVAHCRKDGLPIAGTVYNDIAIIQYNKKNGAVCYYQALTNLPGNSIPSPAEGDTAAWADGQSHWFSPQATEGIGCTACHDNGGFIRSNYIRQLKTPPNSMPSEADGYSNSTSPMKYVGLDFDSNRSWSIVTPRADTDNGLPCNSCHRLGVNNHPRGGTNFGTAALFAPIATAAHQASKTDHSPSSPIWMRPGQIVYNAGAEASAKKYHDCAVAFAQSNFTNAPAGCVVTPLGVPWDGPPIHGNNNPPPSISSVVVDYLDDMPDQSPIIYSNVLP
ncbi:hypothetical protein ACC817_00955 [Rhizobium ruizarguesonis]|uniref:hypothetical protein n=1 Tax=Rhizobium ruizarguesonis TaxID=2081791 RepID=UPI00102FB454|nr:hypothetical protein [Rhizobium ruizarguesonis]TAY62667.1 hypothetical protein ELH84_33760 [Rhizobium ruizarguesonis]